MNFGWPNIEIGQKMAQWPTAIPSATYPICVHMYVP